MLSRNSSWISSFVSGKLVAYGEKEVLWSLLGGQGFLKVMDTFEVLCRKWFYPVRLAGATLAILCVCRVKSWFLDRWRSLTGVAAHLLVSNLFFQMPTESYLNLPWAKPLIGFRDPLTRLSGSSCWLLKTGQCFCPFVALCPSELFSCPSAET